MKYGNVHARVKIFSHVLEDKFWRWPVCSFLNLHGSCKEEHRLLLRGEPQSLETNNFISYPRSYAFALPPPERAS